MPRTIISEAIPSKSQPHLVEFADRAAESSKISFGEGKMSQ
jgi:hypothetical protein